MEGFFDPQSEEEKRGPIMRNDTTSTIHGRISRSLEREIKAHSASTKKTTSAIIRDALEQYLSDARLSDKLAGYHADLSAQIEKNNKAITHFAADFSDFKNLLESPAQPEGDQ